MGTSTAEQPGPGIVTFTAQGNYALDRLAADLVDQCDGSPASIADILGQVMSANIEELAEKLTHPPTPDIGPAPDSPEQTARLGPPTAVGRAPAAPTHTDLPR